MRELLEAPSQRIIRILEYLSSQEDWTTMSALSQAAEASERTISQDIAIMQRRWGQYLDLQISKQQGTRINNINASGMGLVFTDLFNESFALRWIRELLFHPEMPLEFYADRLYVSRSTLLRMLPRINKFLSERGMLIQCNNNQYGFIAQDEHHLRDFSASFLLELYGLDLEKFDLNLDLTRLGQILAEILLKGVEPRRFNWILDDDITFAYQIMYLIISLARENAGYRIPYMQPDINEFPENQIAYLKNHFTAIEIDNLEAIQQDILKHFNGWDSEQQNKQAMKAIGGFLDRVLSILQVTPKEETLKNLEFALESVCLNAKLRPYPTSALFDRIHYFSRELEKRNHRLFRIVVEQLKPFGDKIGMNMVAKAPEILFWMCLMMPELYRTCNPKRALLISDFGKPHGKFLVDALSETFTQGDFPLLFIEHAANPNNLSEEVLKDYDLLITTIPNLPLSHPQVVLVHDYPGLDDHLAIYKTLIG